jgi:hypothetical protein
VELRREGDDVSITEHTGRFTRGKYQSWVEDGSIKQWLVVDCRTSIPQDTCEGGFFPESRNLLTWADEDSHLWRAIFSNKFQDLEIRNDQGTLIHGPFALHGPVIS